MKAFLKAVEYYLPKNVVTNTQLAEEFPEWTAKKVFEKVGIKERRIAAPGETAADMAYAAAEKLFSLHPDILKSHIDFIILCTQSPDYLLPTSACILQHKLGLGTNTGALDFNLGCSGYIYGIAIAKGLILSGIAKNVLLLTAETYSKYLHELDKGNRTIFGDAASATVISSSGFAEIGEIVLGTDGSGAENLIVRSGAARFPDRQHDLSTDENGHPVSSDHLYMNGSEIFSFTQVTVPRMVEETCQKNGLLLDEIDLHIYHQANKYMLDFMKRKLMIPDEKFYSYMEKVGNTVSSSIPIALCEAIKEGLLKGNILLAGFGVGYSWGGLTLRAESNA